MSDERNREQAVDETRTRPWSIADADALPVDPASIKFQVRRQGELVTWTTDGANGTIQGVVDNDDGTGTWTVAAGDLDPGTYAWRALVTIGGQPRKVEDLYGTLRITEF